MTTHRPSDEFLAARDELRHATPKATCAACGRPVRVRRDGLAYSHYDPTGKPCWGAIRPPIEQP